MKKLLPVFLLLVVCSALAIGQQFPPVIPNTFIQDHANVLNANQRATLEDKVRQLKSARDIEFALITVPTTGGYNIHEYGTAIGRAYGIGSKDGEHRGLLVLLAIQDRNLTIQPSRHLEGVITDGQTGEVGRGMKPFLKAQDYYGALNFAVDNLTPLAMKADVKQQQNVAGDQPKPKSHTSLLWLLVPAGLIGLVGGGSWWFEARRRRKQAASRPVTLVNSSNFPTTDPIFPPVFYPAAGSVNRPAKTHRARPVDYEPPEPARSTNDDYESPSPSPSIVSDSPSITDSGFGGTTDFGGGGTDTSW